MRIIIRESGFRGSSIAWVLFLLSAGCGKKEPVRGALETPEYQEWKSSQSLRAMASAGASEKIDGSVLVQIPQDRSKHPEDFLELYLNGQPVLHTAIRTPSGFANPFSIPLLLRPGPDFLDLWDSTTNKYYRFTIDTRQGTDYVFTPTAAGYDLTWTKREN